MPLLLALVEIFVLLWGTGLESHHTIQEAGHLIEVLGVILIGWGVVLEERNGVSHLLGGVPNENSDTETAIDGLCHHDGLAMLGRLPARLGMLHGSGPLAIGTPRPSTQLH